MTLEGRPVLKGQLQGEFWRLRQAHEKTAGTEKTGAEIIHSEVEVDSVPITRFGNPTA